MVVMVICGVRCCGNCVVVCCLLFVVDVIDVAAVLTYGLTPVRGSFIHSLQVTIKTNLFMVTKQAPIKLWKGRKKNRKTKTIVTLRKITPSKQKKSKDQRRRRKKYSGTELTAQLYICLLYTSPSPRD